MIFLFSSFLAAQEYLTAKKVHKILNEHLSQFSCSDLEAGLYTVEVRISRDGVAEAQSEVSCLRDISSISFPVHASYTRRFQWKIAQQQKVLFIQDVQHIPHRTPIVPGILSLEKENWYFEVSQQR